MAAPFDSPLLLTSGQTVGVSQGSFSKVFEKTSNNLTASPETSWISAGNENVPIGNTKKFTLSFWFKPGIRRTMYNGIFEIRSGSLFQPIAGSNKLFQFYLTEGTSTEPQSIFNVATYPVAITLNNVRASRSVNEPGKILDVSAWYHIVLAIDTTQAVADNRVRLYVNNKEIGMVGSTNPFNQNEDVISGGIAGGGYTLMYGAVTDFASSTGSSISGSQQHALVGQLAEVNFVVGQQLDPTYFGAYDNTKGLPRWAPTKYKGTFGVGGHYLEMKTNLAGDTWLDSGPNGINFQQILGGVTQNLRNRQQVVDVPFTFPLSFNNSTGIGKEIRGNYCTLQGSLHSYDGYSTAPSFIMGNLGVKVTSAIPASNWQTSPGTMTVNNGSWYYEATIVGLNNTATVKDRFRVGFMRMDGNVPQTYIDGGSTTSRLGFNNDTWSLGVDGTNGLFLENNNIKTLLVNGTVAGGQSGICPVGTIYNPGDVIGCYMDLNSSPAKFWFSYKNALTPSGSPTSSSVPPVWLNKYVSPTSSTSGLWWKVETSLTGTVAIACTQSATGQIFKSTNSGQTWAAQSVNVGGTIYSTGDWRGVATSNNGAVLLGVRSGDVIYVSTDSGSNWARKTTDTTASSLVNKWTGCAMNTGATGGNPGKYQAAFCSETVGAIPGVWVSGDFGGTWTKRLNEQIIDLAISDTGQSMVAITTTSIWRSSDFGVTWSQPFVGSLLGIGGGSALEGIAFAKDDSIALNSKRILISLNNGGFAAIQSQNGGTSWFGVYNTVGMPTGRFSKPCMSKDGQYQMIVGRNISSAGAAINSRIISSNDYGSNWVEEHACYSTTGANLLPNQVARDFISCAMQGPSDALVPMRIVLAYPSGTVGGRLFVSNGETPQQSRTSFEFTPTFPLAPAISWFRGTNVAAENTNILNNEINVNFGQKTFTSPAPLNASPFNTTSLPEPPYLLPNKFFDVKTREGTGKFITESVFLDQPTSSAPTDPTFNFTISPADNNCVAYLDNGFSAGANTYLYVRYSIDSPLTFNAFDRVMLPSAARDFVFSPDGNFIYVVGSTGVTVVKLNGINSAPTILRTISTSVVGDRRIAIAPNGVWLYVVNFDTSSVTIIELNNNDNIIDITGFTSGNQIALTIAVSPDNRYVYTASNNGRFLYCIDRFTNNLIETVDFGTTVTALKTGIAVDPNGLYIVRGIALPGEQSPTGSPTTSPYPVGDRLLIVQRNGSGGGSGHGNQILSSRLPTFRATRTSPTSWVYSFFPGINVAGKDLTYKPEFYGYNGWLFLATTTKPWMYNILTNAYYSLINGSFDGNNEVYFTNSYGYVVPARNSSGTYYLQTGGYNRYSTPTKTLQDSLILGSNALGSIFFPESWTLNGTANNVAHAQVSKDGNYVYTLSQTGGLVSKHKIYPTQIKTNFSPAMVWTKNFAGTAASHHLAYILPNTTTSNIFNKIFVGSTDSNATVTDLKKGSFFNILEKKYNVQYYSNAAGDKSELTNRSGDTYVDWLWSNNLISITHYTGDGTTPRSIPHTLGTIPKWVITKEFAASTLWYMYVSSFDGPTNYATFPNTYSSSSTLYLTNSWTTTNVVIGSNAAANQSGQDYVMIAFAEIEGLSKMGRYQSTGTSNNLWGTFVYTGFAPKCIFIKRAASGSSYNWVVVDSVSSKRLSPSSNVLNDDNLRIEFYSNGFKINSLDSQIGPADVYFYIAFAAAPFKYASTPAFN